MNIDKIDRQILHELQKNARISNLQLAEKVNLSPGSRYETLWRVSFTAPD